MLNNGCQGYRKRERRMPRNAQWTSFALLSGQVGSSQSLFLPAHVSAPPLATRGTATPIAIGKLVLKCPSTRASRESLLQLCFALLPSACSAEFVSTLLGPQLREPSMIACPPASASLLWEANFCEVSAVGGK